MKTAYRNIYQVLQLNRLIVFSVVAIALGSSFFSGLMVYNIYQESLDNAFAISTDGNVIPLQLVSQKENLEVEAFAHLDLFHQYFYGLDASNYEKNLEKALWLGDSSVDNLYRQKKADGVYNRLLQYSLVQKVILIDTELDLTAEPYKFRTTTYFEINRGTVIDNYTLMSTGQLISVDRNFPRNTHGLLITNYFENSLKKTNNDSP
jgi:hypothetical protein